MGEILELVIRVFIVATAAVITLWMAGAIYYDVCSEARWGRFLAAVWVLSVVVSAARACLPNFNRCARNGIALLIDNSAANINHLACRP